MLVENKAWDWNSNTNDQWNIPSEDSYYLLDRWEEKGFRKFLDLGCGLGRHSIQFAKAGFAVFAYDLSKYGIEKVKEKAKLENIKIDAFCGDMISLPYKSNSMDCLLAYHVISHTDTIGIIKVIDEIYRVLKPKGEFYLTLCSKKAWSFKEAGFPEIDSNTVKKIEDGPENGIPHFFADESTIETLFRKFSIISLKQVQDIIVDKKKYESWHYYILGSKEGKSI